MLVQGSVFIEVLGITPPWPDTEYSIQVLEAYSRNKIKADIICPESV